MDLDPLERAPCSNREVGLRAISGSPTEDAKIIDKVKVHSVSLILFSSSFLSAQSPSSDDLTESIRRVNSRKTHCLSIASKAASSGLRPKKGGDLLRRQEDVLCRA